MKKEKNLFSIGEIAKALGVTRRIILNYEQRGLIQPDIKEGTTGNRYYTIDSFTKLRSIRIFQNLGLSLDEIRAYFNDSSDILPLIRRLEKLRDELNLNIEKLYERVQTGEAQIKTIRLERQRIYRRSYHSETIAERTVALRNTALEAMHAYGTDTTRRMYFTEYPVTAKAEVSFCVAIPPESEGEFVEWTESMPALCIYHHGAYEEMYDVVQKLLEYAKENGLEPRGMVRNTYLEGPPQHKDPHKFITQVALPLGQVEIRLSLQHKSGKAFFNIPASAF